MPSSTRKPECPHFVEFPDLSAPAKKRAGCAFGDAERTGNATNGQAFLKAERRQRELRKHGRWSEWCGEGLQQRCIMLPIQDQVARFDSQRGAIAQAIDANTPLVFRMPQARINNGEFDLVQAA